MRELLSEPRRHHYLFAHRFVRAACAADPLRFFAIMASNEQAQFINHIWRLVCKQLDGREADDFKMSDIRVSPTRLRNYPAVIITMPEPRALAEAYFVVIVLFFEIDADNSKLEEPPFRYFTLECGMNLDGTDRTVLCEWNKEGHVNFGDGPKPEIGELLDAIKQVIGGTRSVS
jgi:hypothetical protein